MKSHTLLRFVIGVLAVALVLGAAAPSAWAQGDESRTVTDVMGREVTIDSAPQRIVGMSASITEVLYAIGVTPVGATAGIDYPEAAASLPTFGTGYQPDLEALAALEPDLIIGSADLNAQILDQLEAIAPTVIVLIQTPSDVPAVIRLVGQATYHDTSAEYLAHTYDSLLTLVQDSAPADGPSVLIIVGTLSTPNYGKASTYLGGMVTMLGGTVVGDDQPDAGPFPGYAQLSVEQVLDADPDFILTITRGAPGATPIPEEIAADSVWSSLSAVQNGHVYELDNRLFLESPGPRVVDALMQLRGILYGGGMPMAEPAATESAG
ncbi:MAG TPA: ABC transporter substrate-binding protein [Aggregatilinea sp.]|uniref:ABC transporter substrate-binding protein n=1 Tax=Aggregatilinea sp. TaxID=2806333 RepID=UPI002BE08A74|nr:ABC transporter substrate-binding protein [Aggregatilinea sp.]HML23650.1 ABC transporter substrate-binding protein [Aggregatilinea sp.]